MPADPEVPNKAGPDRSDTRSPTQRQLWEDLYAELRRIAHARLRNQLEPAMPGTTSLVHHAYLHLRDADPAQWPSHADFLRFASVTMRNLLVDEARALHRLKRDPRQADAVRASSQGRSSEILDLHQALEKLSLRDPRLGSIVECRFFAGLTVEETAIALDLSPATVKRGWDTARVWLFRHLESVPE